MNRHLRRKMRTHAAPVARLFAADCYDYTPQGQLVRVTNPHAVKLLERAFAYMLKNGGEPHVICLTHKDACAFPRGRLRVRSLPTHRPDSDLCKVHLSAR